MSAAQTCSDCATTGRRGYCAPQRCYCGHGTCYAFASYVPLAASNITPLPSRQSTTWADREEPTWIDSM